MRLIPTRLRLFKRLNLKRRLAGRAEPGPPAPFVIGATRSGTTLLRLMLDAHPDVAIPSETHFFHKFVKRCEGWRVTPDELANLIIEHKRWGDFHLDPDELRARFRALHPLTMSDALRAFYGLYAEKQGKPRWGDKTPGYLRYMRRIEWVLPEARFIHLVRDGRDVALSVLPMNWGPSSITEAAELWVERVTIAREQGALVEHYMEVKYEDLVTDTEPTLRRVADFLELPWDPAMLDYHERAEERLKEKARDLPRKSSRGDQPAAARMASHAMAKEPPNPNRIGRWRTEMSAEDRALYDSVAGELLVELGYQVGEPAEPEPAAVR
jgi:sulfotransferase family protein